MTRVGQATSELLSSDADVVIALPANNDILQYNSATAVWVNTSLANAGVVPSSRLINTTSPLSGGGNLSTDRTLSIGGLSTIGPANNIVGVNSAGTIWEYKNTTGSGSVVLADSPAFTTSPTAPTQAIGDNSTKLATTAFVAEAVVSQNYKEAVRVATTANLVGTYLNGSSGVGATFVYTATGTDTIDGITLALNDRVLLKNQTSDFQNGIYKVTTAGAIGVAGILTRATDFDQSSEINTGDAVFITAGTTQATTTWIYTGIDAPTMGTTSLTFVQIAGQGSFTGGNGITITGTSIAIDTSITVDKTTAQTLTNKTLTSPILTTPALGTPASGVMTSVTGLPLATGVTGTLPIANGGTGSTGGPGYGFFQVDRNGSTQSITASTHTVAQFNHEVADVLNWFDTTTYRYTPQVAGTYFIYCSLFLVGAGSAGNYPSIMRIQKNGSVVGYGGFFNFVPSTTFQALAAGANCVSMNGSTDYIDFTGYTDDTTPVIDGTVAFTFAFGWRIAA